MANPHKAPCQVCKTPVFDMTRRFCPVLGYLCETCHSFGLFADKQLRKYGIEGSASPADRKTSQPKPQDP